MSDDRNETGNPGESKRTTYMVLGMCFGAGLGITFGTAFDMLALGLPIGAGVGMIAGLLFHTTGKEE